MSFTNKIMDYKAINLQPGGQEIVVSPQIARFLLSTEASFQRSISKLTVAKYAADMRRGKWLYSPHLAIAISVDGEIIDGQHRLAAVIESGVPQKFMVFYGVDTSVFSVTDRNRVRTLTQIASMSGNKFSAGHHVSAVNALLWDVKTPTSASKAWPSSEVSSVLDYFSSELAVVFPASYSGSTHYRQSPIRGAILRALISRKDQQQKVSKFVEILATGYPDPDLGVEGSKMAIMLRNIASKMTGSLGTGGRGYNGRHKLWLTSLNCLKHFLDGTAIKSEHNARHQHIKTQPFPIFTDSKQPYESFDTFACRVHEKKAG